MRKRLPPKWRQLDEPERYAVIVTASLTRTVRQLRKQSPSIWPGLIWPTATDSMNSRGPDHEQVEKADNECSSGPGSRLRSRLL